MLQGYATVCPSRVPSTHGWWATQEFLVACVGHYVVPALLTGTVIFALSYVRSWWRA